MGSLWSIYFETILSLYLSCHIGPCVGAALSALQLFYYVIPFKKLAKKWHVVIA